MDVDPVSGPLAGGGSYDITTDVGTEILACASGGLRVHLGSSWALEAALRLDQHFTDWTVTDQLSGTTGQVDDYLAKGGHLGISFRF